MTRARRAESAIAAVVIVAAALIVFAPPLARSEIFTFRDHSDYFTPMRWYTAKNMRAGHLPLWNPYNGSGEQWLANPQTGVFYPPAWLFLVLPFPTAYVFYLLLHTVILGSGAYALFRRRAGTAAALAGSVALMFSGPVLSLLDVQNNFTTFAWVPWIVWSALRDRGGTESLVEARPGTAADGGTDRSVGATQVGATQVVARSPRLSAFLLAFAFLAGEPFYAAVAALVYAIVVRKPRTIAIAGAGAFAISAIQLLPFADMLIGSDRFGGFVASDVLRSSMRGEDWLRCVIPPRLMAVSAVSEQFVPVLYGGVLVLLLAIAGIVAMLRGREYGRLASWAILAACAAVVATGPQWIASIPLTLFRYPSRCMPFLMLAVAAFATAGWESLRRRSIIVDAVLIAAIVADLVVAARPLLVSAPLSRPRLQYPAFVGQSQKILQVYGSAPLRSNSQAWISGYLNLFDRRFVASTPAPLAPTSYTRLWYATLSDFGLLRFLGIGYVLVPRDLPPPFTPVTRIGGVRTYRVPASLPMAWVRLADGKNSPPRALWLDASRARVTVATDSGGLLVLTQNDVRGWRVLVDGRSAEKKTFLGTFRAVDVPPGTHEVTWVYRPASLLAGAALTFLSLFWLAFGARDAFIRQTRA